MSTVKRNGDKIILNNNAVSCNCCCSIDSCDNIVIPTYGEVYEIFKFKGGGWLNPATNQVYGNDAFNSPYPLRFRRTRACLRFYYRVVNEEIGAGGAVLCEGNIGPSGARGGLSAAEEVYGYREDKPNLLVGESCGIYVYVIEFYYWNSSCSGPFENQAVGGAQRNESGDCETIRVYNVDMFTVGQVLWSFGD